MPYSELQIYNLALTRCGSSRQLASTDDASKEGALLRLMYPIARDTTLAAHPWNFAIKRAALAQAAGTPAFEFDYYHQLPEDCLKVVRTSIEADNIDDDYRIEGDKLLANESAVKIEYIARIETTGLYTALFVDVLAARLAFEVNTDLTDNATISEKLMAMYDAKLKEARSVDAQQGTPRHVIDDTGWLIARHGYSGWSR